MCGCECRGEGGGGGMARRVKVKDKVFMFVQQCQLSVFVYCFKLLLCQLQSPRGSGQSISCFVFPSSHSPQPTIGVRASEKALLYCITCPVGPYFSTGTFTPISLYADPGFIRAWPGGAGESKMGGQAPLI